MRKQAETDWPGVARVVILVAGVFIAGYQLKKESEIIRPALAAQQAPTSALASK